MASPQTPPEGQVQALVVGADPARLDQYGASMRENGVSSRQTEDVDEAESVFTEQRPAAVILDSGLSRMALFRLYGLVRGDTSDPPVKLIFVGQLGDTGPDDHYVPGDPSPATVVTQVRTLLPRPRAAAPAAPPVPPPVPPPPPPRAETPPPATRPPATDASGPVTPPPATREPAVSGAAPAGEKPEPQTIVEPPAPASAEKADSEAVAVAAAAASDAATPAAATATPAPRKGPRLDVVLIRVGIVLLIVGALLFLLRTQAMPAPVNAPAPSTAPTRKPAASPSPSALRNVNPAALYNESVSIELTVSHRF